MAASDTSTPVLILRPATALSWQDFRDAWAYRELLWTLALREVRVRYKQASLGVAWALVQPLAQMLIFTILFHRLAGIQPDGGVPYPVFSFAGLTVWALFASGMQNASESLLRSENLVTKVYFPRVLLPLSSILTAAVDASIASVMLVVLMVITQVPLHASMLLAIPIASLAALCAAAIGMWTSALNLQYRDVRHAMPLLIQLGLYATPVFYSASLVPEKYRTLLALNPMAAVVDGARAALFGTAIPWGRLALAVAAALAVGLLGFIRFLRLEKTFADRI